MPTSFPVSKEELIAALQAGETFEYRFFWGHRMSTDAGITKSCCSQWYESAFKVGEDVFRTAEHYMMFRKALLFEDAATAEAILQARTPNEAKSLGRKVKKFDQAVWLAHREEIVFTGNVAKFSQKKALRTFLLDTGSLILVEASPVDAIWGIGLAEADPNARLPAAWPGLNLLGFALVKVREQLRSLT
jgi:ribA/ribD-fused uncharacterized protein